MPHDINDPSLSDVGEKKILWAQQQMPVLRRLREQYAESKPLAGLRVGACLHVTAETGALLLALQAVGAEVSLCAANPLSTQDDAAAALVSQHGISVYARRDEDNETYYRHLDAVLDTRPHLLLDDGADLITELHKQRPDQLSELIGATEETSTGVVRLQSMARSGVLKFPIIAVNNARSKYLFDNCHGTGQSTVDGIVRATNMLLAGKHLVVCGYGWCGKGIAMRARGLGAITTVVEINPMQALEAAMDGYFVTTMEHAAELGDIFVTATGDLNVIRRQHFARMKSGALMCNAGHFNSEIEIQALEDLAQQKEEVRPYVMAYHLDQKTLYLLADGRLVNLSCAEGHPAAVMDLSFANQMLTLIHLAQQHHGLAHRVYPVPTEIDEQVAHLKLDAMGICIDQRTQEQLDYQLNWELGT